MKTVFKILIGAGVRHWLSGFLTLLVAHKYLSPLMAASLPIDSAFSDDYIFDSLAAALGAILPSIWAFVSRMRAKLKERLALLLPWHTTEHEVKGMIADAPLATRISATLTADPDKIINAPPK